MTDRNTILSEIKRAVFVVDDSAEVVLFGSQARGDFHEESDWDILVLNLRNDVNVEYKQRIWRSILAVELSFGIPVSVIIRNKNDWNDAALTWFYKEVENDGQLLS